MESTQNTQSTKNVPGAFSSNKGRDFHAVLEALCSVCDDAVSIPEPYDAKRTKLVWNKAGEWETITPSHGERLTLNTGECPNVARESTLSQILQADAPEKYYLSPRKLARGICRRANEAGQEVTADAVGGVDGSVGAAGVVSKGNGECFIMPERHMSLSIGGGQAGQGYPCAVYSFDSLSSNSMKSANPKSGCRAVEIAKCIDTTYPDPSKNQGGMAVVSSTTKAAQCRAPST